MKKIVSIFLILSAFIAPALAQVSTPLPLREGSGEGLLLSQLKDSALRHNIAIRTARLSIDAAKEQRKEAFTKYFPNVSCTGLWFNANKPLVAADVTPSNVLPEALAGSLAQMLPAEALAALASPVSIGLLKNGMLGGVTAVQPIFAGGQIVNSNKLTRIGEDVSRLQLRLSENEVEEQTEQYYWQLMSLQDKMQTVEAVEALLTDIHKDVEVAVRAGVALRNDLLQVQLRQNDVESQKLKLRNGITIVSILLAQYCGLETDGKWKIENGEFAAALHSAMDSIDGTAVANSPLSTINSTLSVLPEYQLLNKQLSAATLQKKLAVGQNLPTVGLGVGYNYHNLMDTDQTRAMVFATVSVPISDWWGGAHAIKRRKIEQQRAEAQLADGAELLKIRMQKAWNDVDEARLQLDIARRSIEQSQENLRLHRDYYRAGTATMSDLLEAQLLHQQALDHRTDALADYHLKLLTYRHATAQP